MQKKQSNKKGIKIPKFTVTPYVGFFDVYFRTPDRVHLELEQWCNNLSLLPTNRTDECHCRLCTTEKFTDQDSAKEYEVYLSQYQQDEGYSAVARFKNTHSNVIEDLLCCHFEYDEFFIKRVQYVFDFESKKPEDLLELITGSIEIDLNSTVYGNIHAYVETCEIAESKESIIRLNIVVDYPHSKTGIGVFRDTESEADQILDHIKFCIFDQNTFFSALPNQCMQITESQMESLKEQLQEIANMNNLRKINFSLVK